MKKHFKKLFKKLKNTLSREITYKTKEVEFFPPNHELEKDIIYILDNKKMCKFICPCGTKHAQTLYLGEKVDRHRNIWTLTVVKNKPTIRASVWNHNCNSHYFITNGKVKWCK